MRFFWTKDFPGLQPTGVAAIVIATDYADARRKLRLVLRKRKMNPPHGFEVFELTQEDGALILCDGDY